MNRILVLLFALLTGAADARAAEPLGRLFFSPEQRMQMDLARTQRSRATLSAEVQEEASPPPEVLTYRGIVRRSDGTGTLWINDRAINDAKDAGGVPAVQPRPDRSIVVTLPQSDRRVNLKVGQSVELRSGTVAEPYARVPTEAKTATASKGPNPPAAGTAAKASGHSMPRPEQERAQVPEDSAATPTAAPEFRR